MAAITICSDFGVQKQTKSDPVSTVSPSISHEVMGPDAMQLIRDSKIKKQQDQDREIRMPVSINLH